MGNKSSPSIEVLEPDTVKVGRVVYLKIGWRTICNMRKSMPSSNVTLFFKEGGIHTMRPGDTLRAIASDWRPPQAEKSDSKDNKDPNQRVTYKQTDVQITIGMVVFDIVMKEPALVVDTYGRGGNGVADLDQAGRKWSVSSTRLRPATKRERGKLFRLQEAAAAEEPDNWA